MTAEQGYQNQTLSMVKEGESVSVAAEAVEHTSKAAEDGGNKTSTEAPQAASDADMLQHGSRPTNTEEADGQRSSYNTLRSTQLVLHSCLGRCRVVSRGVADVHVWTRFSGERSAPAQARRNRQGIWIA